MLDNTWMVICNAGRMIAQANVGQIFEKTYLKVALLQQAKNGFC